MEVVVAWRLRWTANVREARIFRDLRARQQHRSRRLVPGGDAAATKLGWKTGDLWGIAYNGVGCTNDGALFTLNNGYGGWTASSDRASSTGCVVTGNEQNVADLKAFVDSVMRYTGARRVNIVAHSLGVTVARRMLWEHPEMYAKVAGFVGIAGGNHGTSFCPPGSESDVESCNEIASGTKWLAQMNNGPRGRKVGTPGSNEVPENRLDG